MYSSMVEILLHIGMFVDGVSMRARKILYGVFFLDNLSQNLPCRTFSMGSPPKYSPPKNFMLVIKRFNNTKTCYILTNRGTSLIYVVSLSIMDTFCWYIYHFPSAYWQIFLYNYKFTCFLARFRRVCDVTKTFPQLKVCFVAAMYLP